MIEEENKKLIKKCFKELLEDEHATPEMFGKYFSEEYIQHVDGVTLDYQGLLAHAATLKSRVKNIKVELVHLVAEGDKVCSVHLVDSMRDNALVKMKVIALFQLKENKIILCDELTHMILGDEEDRNLGSA